MTEITECNSPLILLHLLSKTASPTVFFAIQSFTEVIRLKMVGPIPHLCTLDLTAPPVIPIAVLLKARYNKHN